MRPLCSGSLGWDAVRLSGSPSVVMLSAEIVRFKTRSWWFLIVSSLTMCMHFVLGSGRRVGRGYRCIAGIAI
jgi:hypothetical protein